MSQKSDLASEICCRLSPLREPILINQLQPRLSCHSLQFLIKSEQRLVEGSLLMGEVGYLASLVNKILPNLRGTACTLQHLVGGPCSRT